jgi:transposase InsO family protein
MRHETVTIPPKTLKQGHWAMDDNYKTPLIEKAIEMAASNYPLAENAIFHSDRGSNYISCQFAVTLKRNNLRQSVGRTGMLRQCDGRVVLCRAEE